MKSFYSVCFLSLFACTTTQKKMSPQALAGFDQIAVVPVIGTHISTSYSSMMNPREPAVQEDVSSWEIAKKIQTNFAEFIAEKKKVYVPVEISPAQISEGNRTDHTQWQNGAMKAKSRLLAIVLDEAKAKGAHYVLVLTPLNGILVHGTRNIPETGFDLGCRVAGLGGNWKMGTDYYASVWNVETRLLEGRSEVEVSSTKDFKDYPCKERNGKSETEFVNLFQSETFARIKLLPEKTFKALDIFRPASGNDLIPIHLRPY